MSNLAAGKRGEMVRYAKPSCRRVSEMINVKFQPGEVPHGGIDIESEERGLLSDFCNTSPAGPKSSKRRSTNGTW